ncbi:hypothetical protein [Leuconostoc falkenbergense]|uniref:hypothetical protein n=1 Tax=Leuconostoc falkenbergense TaxID=2766470 RepID=UPI0024A96104|nr:hypothetical protein [Leuconostoc falkenbergense]MDI6553327.1 hypothetical protein [Leuconostoc falkenbergense]
MFKSDKLNYLQDFLEKHPGLNEDERKVIKASINNLNNPKVLEYKEVTSLTNSFQKLSLDGKLSDDGKLLLQHLHRSDWFSGIMYNLKFFGN